MSSSYRLPLLRILSLFFISILFASSLHASEDKLLYFGRVQDNVVKAVKQRQAFVDYIAKKLASLGFTGSRIVVFSKLNQLAKATREGKVHLFHDSVVPSMVISKWSGSVPFLRQWKYGQGEYNGIILVRKNSGIKNLADLKGKIIAFDEPHSTSAHILPRMLLAKKKIEMYKLISPDQTTPGKLGYIHTSDGNSSRLVVADQVDAAGTTHRELHELRPEIREELKVIAETRNAPRLLISIPKDLDPQLAKSLRGILLNMDKDPEGQQALKKQQKTTKIDEIPKESMGRLDEIQKFVFSTMGSQINSW